MIWNVAGIVPSSFRCISILTVRLHESRLHIERTRPYRWQKQPPMCLGGCNSACAIVLEKSLKTVVKSYLPSTALLSPISLRSSMSSHILGYVTLTSSTSTVNKVNPARPIRFDMSLLSKKGRKEVSNHEYRAMILFYIPVIGDTRGEIPPSLSASASCNDVLNHLSQLLSATAREKPINLSSKSVSPPKSAPRKTPSGFNTSLICTSTPEESAMINN